MVSFRVLSRINLVYHSHHSTLNPRSFNLLQPLCRRQKSQLLWNQANPASFCKTPGVGVPPQGSPLKSSTSSLTAVAGLFFRAPVATQLTPQLTPMLLITSIQTQHFHAITHSFPQRRQPICFFYKVLRTLLPLTAISFFPSSSIRRFPLSTFNFQLSTATRLPRSSRGHFFTPSFRGAFPG